jgi:hypothetical protein
MGDLAERGIRATAAKAGEADCGAHSRKILCPQVSLGGCGLGRLHDGPPRLLDADPRRGRPGACLAEQPAVFVLNAGTAAGSAAVDAEIRGIFCSHRNLTRWLRSGSGQCPLRYIGGHLRHQSHQFVTAPRMNADG